MRLRDLAFITGGAVAAASAATLVYGALTEANRLVVERLTLPLSLWPERLRGFKIALIADLHLRDKYSEALAKRAVAVALDEAPDFVVLAGDYVAYWKPQSQAMLKEVLDPLLLLNGNVVAVPGNHDYWEGDASLLLPVFDPLNIKLLRNEIWNHGQITWVGVDSANAYRADPFTPMLESAKREMDVIDARVASASGADPAPFRDSDPKIVVWHEPDPVDWLPSGAALMLSGHSHGGQFTFPWGWTPMHTKNGAKYVRGFYPQAPTPLYVSRGIGTTGPPSRLGCAPEVAILTLVPASDF